jgi:hypothetical protein
MNKVWTKLYWPMIKIPCLIQFNTLGHIIQEILEMLYIYLYFSGKLKLLGDHQTYLWCTTSTERNPYYVRFPYSVFFLKSREISLSELFDKGS